MHELIKLFYPSLLKAAFLSAFVVQQGLQICCAESELRCDHTGGLSGCFWPVEDFFSLGKGPSTGGELCCVKHALWQGGEGWNEEEGTVQTLCFFDFKGKRHQAYHG